ncbi:SRPBCC family protein [Pseudonocardia sp. KRD-184]|uniref:SRPBCC family protein n=1 Tax=Pseudonocardia oceani TaxID=2792013 RepID=A0ABS6UEG5_9PSEU|nr:SRPBCC family protein [Pseudonocardia oceani]MBW0092630.1 SRPBCC family protein [Pseudonocardia oceani]MBW0100216.1 SRPBCC family protein [Pseudonocardia oceani]MBW0113169.1 SRPBCC family protein [Pseudonocardia oceani]MBW0121680.1 SRPBCC family protein [Pseudonocardia oceani]MBW0130642.1 SRPBCC family protein [Pseudonocardia oceani]
MVEVRRRTRATVGAVWAVLADGWSYPLWVVGAARMRAVSTDWPAPGARLLHSLGLWPALIDDTTHVLDSRPGSELRLRGRGWPTGEVQVHLLLEQAPDGGCEITMREEITAGPGRLLIRPVRYALMAPRNVESLRRLAYLAERRSP